MRKVKQHHKIAVYIYVGSTLHHIIPNITKTLLHGLHRISMFKLFLYYLFILHAIYVSLSFDLEREIDNYLLYEFSMHFKYSILTSCSYFELLISDSVQYEIIFGEQHLKNVENWVYRVQVGVDYALNCNKSWTKSVIWALSSYLNTSYLVIFYHNIEFVLFFLSWKLLSDRSWYSDRKKK